MQAHPFDPIIFPDSKILILGSFPSLKSFEKNFYYAHPRNQFWPLLAAVFNEENSTIEAKISLCQKHHLALWDSAKMLSRESGNSSDSNLKDIVPNDFKKLLEDFPSIEKVYFTGKKAEAIFNQHFKDIAIEKALLPSPSPAFAAMSFEKKLIRYKELFNP